MNQKIEKKVVINVVVQIFLIIAFIVFCFFEFRKIRNYHDYNHNIFKALRAIQTFRQDYSNFIKMNINIIMSFDKTQLNNDIVKKLKIAEKKITGSYIRLRRIDSKIINHKKIDEMIDSANYVIDISHNVMNSVKDKKTKKELEKINKGLQSKMFHSKKEFKILIDFLNKKYSDSIKEGYNVVELAYCIMAIISLLMIVGIAFRFY